MLIPEHLPPLVGHLAQQQLIASVLASVRCPHAWVLSGPKGVGKFNFALHLAASLFQGAAQVPFQMDQSDPLFRRMKSGGHGDLMILARTIDEKGKVSREISVQQARETTGKLSQTAFEGGWRVVIVDGVEYLNRHGANALLKTLEEPPRKTLFLLITASLGRLLPTIRSRCQVLTFSPLGGEEVRQVISHLMPKVTDQEMGTLLPLAQGSPGRLHHLLSLGGVEFCQEMVKAFTSLRTGSLKDALSFAYRYGDDPEIYDVIEDYIRVDLAQDILKKAEDNVSSPLVQDTLARWEKVINLFQEGRKADLDRKATLSTILSTISREGRAA